MMKKSKRLIALLLSLAMVISLISSTGLAAEAAIMPKLAKKSVSIVIGETSSINVKNAPKGAKITYKSEKNNIATVSKQGKVKGKKSGTTKITVFVKKNSETTKLSYKVTVKKPKLSKSTLSLTPGSTDKLSVKNKPKKATYTWTSSNSRVAAVNKNGRVTAKSEGTAIIKASVKTTNKIYRLSCKITVKSASDDVKQTYTVTFNSNGGSAVAPQTVTVNGKAAQPAAPTRSGYTFDGWYTAASGGQKFDFNKAITGSITLYAHWSSNTNSGGSESSSGSPATREFTVNFYTNDGTGSLYKTESVTSGAKVSEPDVPVREGYTFIDWYTEDNYNNQNFDDYFDFSVTPINSNTNLIAYWVNTSDTTDTDHDKLSDSMEEYCGTDKTLKDTDNDGLSDYDEIIILALDPLKTDTDGDGISDANEDSDGDSLSNIEEIGLGTDPVNIDTDNDSLTDSEEISVYRTDPKNPDTDGDGVSDGKEIELSTDPLSLQEKFSLVVKGEENEDTVIPSVEVELAGEQVETLRISKVVNETLFPDTIPGYLGSAYDFTVAGDFDRATISFEFDSSLQRSQDADPAIYYFNENTGLLEALDTTICDNVASASVTHFSTYILIDRKKYEESFTWQDVWESEHSYSGVEIVLVIDDSGSMYSNDRYNQRLTVARSLIDSLPQNNKIGIVKFGEKTTLCTEQLISNKNNAKSFLTTTYFHSDEGWTYMYDGIDQSFDLFESKDGSVLRMIVALSDGVAHDTQRHSDVVQKSNAKGVKIFTIGLGNDSSYFDTYLKPLADNTGGSFYLASNAAELSDIYANIGEKIDIETDSDDDGIPDFYEDHMVLFNGITITTDKNNPDSDGDGIKDGDELLLNYIYNEDKTRVLVRGVLKSSPCKKDSDDDGFSDTEDKTPLVPECFKDFDSYRRYKYKEKTTLTVFVDQPYRNSRQVINFDDDDEYVGHTYVGIDYGKDNNEYAGFWPYATDKAGNVEGYGTKRAIFRKSVDGMIRMNGGAYLTSGKGSNEYVDIDYNEKEHKWDVAYVYEVSDSKIGTLKEYAKNYTYKYNMVSNNCTTFAVSALKELGISPKIYEHRWVYDGGILDLVAHVYKGYSPADAGEDIRANYKDYIFMDATELADGSIVDAIFPMQ